MKTTNALFGIATITLALSAQVQAQFDVLADFSTNANPNGVWSYGWATAPGEPFQLASTPYSQAATATVGWYNGLSEPDSCFLFKDFASFAISGTIAVYPDTLHLDPQSYAVTARFTAPSNGNYPVNGLFRLEDTGTHAHDLTILANGHTTNFYVFTSGGNYNSEYPFNFSASLAQGETLDFVVSCNGDYHNLGTGLKATIGPLIAGLYNTGVNNDGTLATQGTEDSHYSLVSVPSGAAGTAWVVPIQAPNWWSGATDANWLSPATGGALVDAGQYDYRLTFSLVDGLGHPLDPSRATITGNWAADDSAMLFLNGAWVANNTTGFAYLTPFTVSSGFCAGTNTLDFLVINGAIGPSQSGLLVSDLSGTAAFVARVASATAILTNVFVDGVNITDGGYGYTNTPTVRFIGGGGSGAHAVAVVSNGVVTAINVLDAGYGYASAPLVVIDPPFISNPILGIAPMSFLSFSNLDVGGIYQLQQLAEGYYWTNQPVNFTATNSVYTQMVSGVTATAAYRLALSPVPAQAFAMPEVANGFVVGATVTSGGSGYVTAPPVSIVSDDGGTNAGGFSEIAGGVVTNVVITNAGAGYSNTTTIEIGPPPAAAVSPAVQLVMRVDSASLAPYDNYQIQFTPALGTSWGNWDGGLFTPTDVTNSQYLFVTNATGFFRLQYVP